MRSNKHKITSTQWLIYLAVGLLVAFLPALLRWIGYKSLLPTLGRNDGNITVGLCIVGAGIAVYGVGKFIPKNQAWQITVSILSFIIIGLLAFYTCLFSLFAF
jgi:uncharacterized membrane protein YidH (DUF202 family)